MKHIIIISIVLIFTCSLKAQKKVTVVLGELYMKDTVTILYNYDTLFHSILESYFDAQRTASFQFIPKKQSTNYFRIHINNMKVGINLKDYKRLCTLRIDSLPNPLYPNEKEIRIYKVKKYSIFRKRVNKFIWKLKRFWYQ